MKITIQKFCKKQQKPTKNPQKNRQKYYKNQKPSGMIFK